MLRGEIISLQIGIWLARKKFFKEKVSFSIAIFNLDANRMQIRLTERLEIGIQIKYPNKFIFAQ